MKLAVKYCITTGRHYVQDRDRSYDKINHKMRRIKKYIGIQRRAGASGFRAVQPLERGFNHYYAIM